MQQLRVAAVAQSNPDHGSWIWLGQNKTGEVLVLGNDDHGFSNGIAPYLTVISFLQMKVQDMHCHVAACGNPLSQHQWQLIAYEKVQEACNKTWSACAAAKARTALMSSFSKNG